MRADTRIQADTIDDLLRIQAFHFCIGIKLIEIRNSQCQIRICEQLYRLGLCESHNQRINILLDRPLLQQTCERVCSLHQPGIFHIRAYNDTRRIQVVIQCLRFSQELLAENDVVTMELFPNRCRIANRDRGLDNHDRIRIVLNHELNNRLYG